MGGKTIITATPKILLVEENDDNLLILKKLLKPIKVEFVRCTSTKETLEYLKESEFVLAIVDVQTSGMNAIKSAKLLRKNAGNQNMPIIFLANLSSKEDTHVREVYQENAVDFIFKPIQAEILASKVRTSLEFYFQKKKMIALESQLDNVRKSLIESNNELRTLVKYDSVTGLSNRISFKEVLNMTLVNAKRHNRILAVLFLGLDNFKFVNENYGYDVGDELLKQVSDRLKESIRKGDFLVYSGDKITVSRMTGDEFSLLLSQIKQTENAGEVAHRIIQNISRPFVLSNGIEVEISASIGIACFPAAGDTSEALCKNADMAMYDAKNMGKNSYRYYSEELDISHRRYFLVEESIREALRLKKFYLVYQPILDLKLNKTIAVEALCRCDLESMNGVSPQEFIQVAEETGLMPDLGEWIFRTAVSAAKNELFPINDRLQIHINVSTKQLQESRFLDFIKDVYKKNNARSDRFTIELTETAIIQDTQLLEKRLNEISALGSYISIDDFGTGYSSMAWLRHLPVTSLKIDKAFVDGLQTTSNDSVITKSIIRLADSLELSTIAEGIESKEQLNFLIEHHCPLGQGYYFSKPLTIDKIVSYLKAESK